MKEESRQAFATAYELEEAMPLSPITFPYTAEQWKEMAIVVRQHHKQVVIGASCEKCHLGISPDPSSAGPSQCQCGNRVALSILLAAHGLEQCADLFSIKYVGKAEVG